MAIVVTLERKPVLHCDDHDDWSKWRRRRRRRRNETWASHSLNGIVEDRDCEVWSYVVCPREECLNHSGKCCAHTQTVLDEIGDNSDDIRVMICLGAAARSILGQALRQQGADDRFTGSRPRPPDDWQPRGDSRDSLTPEQRYRKWAWEEHGLPHDITLLALPTPPSEQQQQQRRRHPNIRRFLWKGKVPVLCAPHSFLCQKSSGVHFDAAALAEWKQIMEVATMDH